MIVAERGGAAVRGGSLQGEMEKLFMFSTVFKLMIKNNPAKFGVTCISWSTILQGFVTSF